MPWASNDASADTIRLSRSLFSANGFNADVEPVGFVNESDSAVGPLEPGVAFEHVEANAPLQFAQAHRAEMQWPTIAFGQVI